MAVAPYPRARSTPSPRPRVGVVGGGLIGAGIAEVSARTGHDVVVVEYGAAAATAARRRLEESPSWGRCRRRSVARRS